MDAMFTIFFLFLIKMLVWKCAIKNKFNFLDKKNNFNYSLLNQKEKQIIGFCGKIIEPLDDNGISRIKFLDSYWRIRSKNILKVGEIVEVYKVVGNTLYVKKKYFGKNENREKISSF